MSNLSILLSNSHSLFLSINALMNVLLVAPSMFQLKEESVLIAIQVGKSPMKYVPRSVATELRSQARHVTMEIKWTQMDALLHVRSSQMEYVTSRKSQMSVMFVGTHTDLIWNNVTMGMKLTA